MKYLEQFERKPENLFGKLFWNMLFCLAPIVLFVSLFVLAGVVPMNFNDELYYGPVGFVLVILLAPFISLGWAIVIWLYYSVGNYFLRLFNKLL
ncbi:MAG: hypothetical protein ABJF11_05010 [Reichenbachiella sp.]|uniref:hypothetical protein n=1 Tax=Reichenbachiella sp. TaxID=2184521 RepID=UPI0032640DD7